MTYGPVQSPRTTFECTGIIDFDDHDNITEVRKMKAPTLSQHSKQIYFLY